MNRCDKCKVNIKDDASVCPLCRSALVHGEGTENKYPDIEEKYRRKKLLLRIFLFCAIILGCVSVAANLVFSPDTLWSAIVVCVLAYVYLTLAYTAGSAKSGYKMKIAVAAAVAMALIVAIDEALGYRGWSGNYVFPLLIIGIDIAVLFLIIFNRRNWQSYIPFQFLMILVSLIPFVFFKTHIFSTLKFSYASLIFSAFCFLGTYIIGGPRAWDEVKRRLHF